MHLLHNTVNLPRWGLKHFNKVAALIGIQCKFTPLGFETRLLAHKFVMDYVCKFTPLGFETRGEFVEYRKPSSVNLPRWGLKRRRRISRFFASACKFTPLGFETT